MKNILCFGDSLTWGYDPVTTSRYAYEDRWCTIMQKNLGPDYRVIEEGLNGRTTVFEDPFFANRKGSLVLPILLESHAPLDLVILLIGSNDLKPFINGTAKAAAFGNMQLIRQISTSQANFGIGSPKILLLAPPHIGTLSGLMQVAFEGREEESKQFSEHYKTVADFCNISFLDTSLFLQAHPSDGLHLGKEGNVILANEVTNMVKQILTE